MSNALLTRESTPFPASRSSSRANDSIPDWHAGFLKLLPAIVRHAQIEFQSLRDEARQEAIQEVVVNAMVAYARLIRRGPLRLCPARISQLRRELKESWERFHEPVPSSGDSAAAA